MRTEDVDASRINGSFSLILFSGKWPGAIGSAAFLDRDDDRVVMEPYAPDFSFRVVKGLQAGEALRQAESFVSRHSSFIRSRLVAIKDDYDRMVGYEMRPLYMRTTFGSEDILDISYRQRENHVDIYVKLIPGIEEKL